MRNTVNTLFSRKRYITFPFGISIVAVPVLLILLLPSLTRAQEAPRAVITPGGEYSENARGSLAWTLGELSAGYYLTPRLQYREGFQSTPLRVTTIEPLPTAWNVDVYPNPAQTRLSVALGEQHPALTLKLYDLTGREMQSVALETDARQSQLQLDRLPQGSYILQLVDSDGRVAGSYQIKKIQ
ncbi:MAG: hypothetical protein C0600_04825 [Ignavibacteria bacterium]|nr:MAG: hypothetical protein C0600_04825 [Ignavibacteria bacterium]